MKKVLVLSILLFSGFVYRLDDSANGTFVSRCRVPEPPPKKKSFVVDGALQAAMNKACKGRRIHDLSDIVIPVSDRYGLDSRLVTAVIAAESNFNPCAISPRGAVGLMQVTPLLARRYRIQRHELIEPEKNIRVGVRYLSSLSNRYNGDMVLSVAAYNAGEGAVDRFGGIPPYKETRDFVQKVFSYHPELQLALLKYQFPSVGIFHP